MKSCTGCKYAYWDRNSVGSLHPSGGGQCKYPYKLCTLPACMYWSGWHDVSPKPNGGYINRREELKTDCVYYQAGEALK